MRFLHTADLHIGRTLGEMSLMEEQRYMLNELCSMALENKADAVIIAGDIYQRAAPQAEAMELFDKFVSRLSQSGITVIAISGNHDSELRVSYFSRLVRGSGVYMSESFDGRLQKVELYDEYGEINVWLLPFIRESRVRLLYPDIKISSCTDAVRTVIEHSDVDYSKRNILVAHQFITGGEMSGSEEKTVGTLDNVDASAFEGFDYVALGHIHRAQRIIRESVRYAGSPLKYSFDEQSDKKSAVLLNARDKGNIEIKLLPIKARNDVKRLEGCIKDFMEAPYCQDYVWITVHDEEVPVDTARMLRTVYPNLIRFGVVNSKTKQDMDVSGAEQVEKLDPETLFSDFYASQNNGVRPGEKQLELFRSLFGKEEHV